MNPRRSQEAPGDPRRPQETQGNPRTSQETLRILPGGRPSSEKIKRYTCVDPKHNVFSMPWLGNLVGILGFWNFGISGFGDFRILEF